MAPAFSEMMTEEARQIVDDETTLVAPRFDEEETVVARRVVPLGAAAGNGRLAATGVAPDSQRKRRRSLMIALAFASALGGGVLGGIGLQLYQSRASSNPARDAGTNAHANAPAEVTQPAQVAPQPAPTAEVVNDNDSAAPAGQQHDPSEGESQPAAPAPTAEDAAGASEPPKSPAVDASEDSVEESRAGTRRHGKKGARDGESRLLGRRNDPDDESSRDDDATFGGDIRGKARGDDTTFSRPRHAWRHARHERRRSVDSIRGIFEGQP